MWEYKFQSMGTATEDEVIVILEQLAYAGWELVSYDFGRCKGLFKRAKGGAMAC